MLSIPFDDGSVSLSSRLAEALNRIPFYSVCTGKSGFVLNCLAEGQAAIFAPDWNLH